MPALLFTKFFLPTPRYKQVARSSILAVLTDGFQQGRPLTLVSAPAGYGKSGSGGVALIGGRGADLLAFAG